MPKKGPIQRPRNNPRITRSTRINQKLAAPAFVVFEGWAFLLPTPGDSSSPPETQLKFPVSELQQQILA
jgi:hypothetical protein